MSQPISVFWFRRDLRLEDNAGLFQALHSGRPVMPIFIFDENILNDLADRSDKRVSFIYNSLQKLHTKLGSVGSGMNVFHGDPEKVFETICESFSVAAVYTNEDYEPYALKRDAAIEGILWKKDIPLHRFKDQVIFAKDEVMKSDGTPYAVFSAYARRWKHKLNEIGLSEFPSENFLDAFLKYEAPPFPTLKSIGFEKADYDGFEPTIDESIARNYHQTRNIPSIEGTLKLSVQLRFGTISVRSVVKALQQLNETALNELIWRDFFSAILFHFPHTVVSSFKPAYDGIQWRNNESEFAAWREGRTGYPLVDAGMRQLNETGWMHNRVRMVTASFLCKHLLIDWRWGEAYFAEKLLDFDLSQNVGNWQWAAGSGVDAAPYFRIFNPHTQQQKFDPEGNYIRRWVAEFDTLSYPLPIITHEVARARCLTVYKEGLKTAE